MYCGTRRRPIIGSKNGGNDSPDFGAAASVILELELSDK